MALPVTGPITTFAYKDGPATPLGFVPQWERRIKWKWKQAKPIDRPLPYVHSDTRISRFVCGSSNPNRYVTFNDVHGPAWGSLETAAYNKAYDRFKDKLFDSAELAVSLAERKQAMGMVNARLAQMLSFTRHILRGRWKQAGKALGMSQRGIKDTIKRIRERGIRANAKSSSAAYLEFHFGWSPLVSDIYAAVKVLGSDLPGFRVFSSATVKAKDETYVNGGAAWTREWYEGAKSSVRMMTTVAVTNPNLLLLNQLGLVNPATVLWELIPFSFVIDWFVNVSDFLGGWTDFLGLTFRDSQWTTKDQNAWHHAAYDGHLFDGEFRYFARQVGPFPGPTLSIRQPKPLSPRRGAAAASLLAQQLKTFPHAGR